ncbi:topoisomerase C-terminal repeat-containing protein (plasmid) [Burkholderia vietnamiensis]|uniref:DNA topoisomerase n=1 Tax=Burkholderia vietnamiensis (strain G4 / LMG 22486) TaxID=269482 RepID=A4JV87_BURVG|nr:DNA topoisomerase [Burkholderia vietnamiensis G4]MCB4349378.1 topoisomerase C-terminal repeat-containing protein [Burkholderia vietnamiensis]
MGKKLIVAEKFSVAADIARALGGFEEKRAGDRKWYERDDFVISCGIGHLVEIGVSDEQNTYDITRLPMIPDPFVLKPVQKTLGQLQLLIKLIGRPDVDGLINACDAGREGELIFRYIYAAAKSRKPFERLWLQSMTPEAIRTGMKNLRSAQDMQTLFEAARCRSEADWLMGVNPTCALTGLYTRETGDLDKHSTGRVQGPTLAIIVDREDKIRTFVSKDYWEVHAKFGAQAGAYSGVWIDPQFVKDDSNEDARAERLWSASRASEIAQRCRGAESTSVVDETKPVAKPPPLLFDLTALQREANAKFGFSAKQTLDLAQALYEKHKVLTYPRTDAKALPEDYVETAKGVMQALSSSSSAKFAAEALNNGYVIFKKRIFDNSKISDHFAIIPTLTPAAALSDAERKIYDLVVRRFIAAFYPDAEFQKTVRLTTVAGEVFKSSGSVTTRAGWMAVYGREEGEEDADMCAVQPGERPLARDVDVKACETKAPARYTEATLLAAMEHSGKFVEDEALREALAGRGIGTSATRAGIIEGLLFADAKKRPYVLREGRELVPTEKAFKQVRFLRENGVEALTSPELTGEWERKLKLMEAGKYRRGDFMAEIVAETKRIIERIRAKALATDAAATATLTTPCPKCNGAVMCQPAAYACNCGLRISRVILKRRLTEAEAEVLMRDRKSGVLEGFVSPRTGNKFTAILKFSEALDKLEFELPARGAAAGTGETSATIGACPKCGSQMVQRGDNYFCEKNRPAGGECDFVIWGTIAKKRLTPEVVKALLDPGRTSLLNGFTSSGGKKFSAYLVRKPDFKIGFEFES